MPSAPKEKSFDPLAAVVKAIIDDPACAHVRQVWFPVGEGGRFAYNAVTHGPSGGVGLILNPQEAGHVWFPAPFELPNDDAIVVLVADAGLFRKINSALPH